MQAIVTVHARESLIAFWTDEADGADGTLWTCVTFGSRRTLQAIVTVHARDALIALGTS